MAEKKKVFICELKPGDVENFEKLAKSLRTSKSEAVRLAVRLVLNSLREGKSNGKK